VAEDDERGGGKTRAQAFDPPARRPRVMEHRDAHALELDH
jgi:hypothetical protein